MKLKFVPANQPPPEKSINSRRRNYLAKCAILLGLFANGVVFSAESGGIRFETGETWTHILERAKQENKGIFLDVYTTWCSPCKFMADNIFPLPAVGSFMNEKFICVKAQVDASSPEPGSFKPASADPKMLRSLYSITLYPTYLIFSSDGTLVHRIMGERKTGDEFLAEVRKGLVPQEGYYTKYLEYKKHPTDSIKLEDSLRLALAAGDMTVAQEIADVYVNNTKEDYSKDQLELLLHAALAAKGEAFQYIARNRESIERSIGSEVGGVTKIVRARIVQDELKILFSGNATPLELADLRTRLELDWPKDGSYAATFSKVLYYERKKNSQSFELSQLQLMNWFGEEMDEGSVNREARRAYENSTNVEFLLQAAAWIKKRIDADPNIDATRLDTYACLLYKTGQVAAAIDWEDKAISRSQNNKQGQKGFRENQILMKAGEPISYWMPRVIAEERTNN